MVQSNPNNSYPKTKIIGDILVVYNVIYKEKKSKNNVKDYLAKQIKQTLDDSLKILKIAKIEPKNIVRSKITLSDIEGKNTVFDIHKIYFLDEIDQKLEIQICKLKEDILAKIEITFYLGFNG